MRVVALVVVEAGDGFAVVSLSRFSNKAHRSMIAFRKLSGKGPIQDSAQYSCMQSSLASTFVTVSQSSFAIHVGTVPGSVFVGGGMSVAAVGSTITFTAIGAVLYSCL